MRNFYRLTRTTILVVSLQFVALKVTIAPTQSVMSESDIAVTAPVTASVAAPRSASVPSVALNAITDGNYQPPNNGGPGKTGGSGTRWQ